MTVQNEGGSTIEWSEVSPGCIEAGEWEDTGFWLDVNFWRDDPFWSEISTGDRTD